MTASGIFWFNEPATVWKMISIGIIIIGVVSLQLSDQAILEIIYLLY